jgi:selenocysteine lyase/cysteine desulfurase
MDRREIDELWDAAPGYLDTASYGLPPRTAVEAVQSALIEWQNGSTNWETWDASVDAARETFARLVHVTAGDVAIGANVSSQVGLLAAALPPGSRVLVPDGEYTSNLFPWLVHERRGLAVESVPLSRLAEAIDSATTLVSFSLVGSATGHVAPADSIVEAARHHDAFVVVDATQACGWLPIDASRFDAVVVHAYKWLMSPRGTSFLTLKPELAALVQPLAAGWYAGEAPHTSFYGAPLRLAADARRFDTSPAWFSWVGTQRSLEALERIGISRVHDHDVTLADRLREGLGLEKHASPIVVTETAGGEKKLRAAGVRASVRAGKVRLSCHIYTTERDVDRALEALTIDRSGG